MGKKVSFTVGKKHEKFDNCRLADRSVGVKKYGYVVFNNSCGHLHVEGDCT